MITEGAELIGESGKKYEAVASLGQPNVWVAAEKGEKPNIVVLKEPDAHDQLPWPRFQHEMVMHELFKNCHSIRKQVDRVPPNNNGGVPTLVLEMFETTVWTARTKRPFTIAEVKSICKAVLTGLRDVHDSGLVYCDLKMENIMLNGFDVHKPGDTSKLVTKLGDLGIVMPPAKGQVQPIVYRAPEVHFKGEITSKADIWGWGLIYCHLLEARSRFSETGLYDDLDTGSGSIGERMDAVRHAIANDYEVHADPYYRDVSLPKQDRRGKGNQWEELRRRGLEQGEVDFLRWVMRVDPRKRPSAVEILACGWLDKTEDKIVSEGFSVPLNARGHATIEYDPRRPTQKQATEKRTSRLVEMETANKVPRTEPPPTETGPTETGPTEAESIHARANETKTWTDTFASLPGVSGIIDRMSGNTPEPATTSSAITTAEHDAKSSTFTHEFSSGQWPKPSPALTRGASNGPWAGPSPAATSSVTTIGQGEAKPSAFSHEFPSEQWPKPSPAVTPGASRGPKAGHSSGFFQGHASGPWPAPSPGLSSGPWSGASPGLSPGHASGPWPGPSAQSSPQRQPQISRQTSEAATTTFSPPVDDPNLKRSSASFVSQLISQSAASPGPFTPSGLDWSGGDGSTENGDAGAPRKTVPGSAVRPGMPARDSSTGTYLSYR